MEVISEKNQCIAYFCSEFAIDNDLPTYSGGLGILAGDLMNAAADENFPLIGIGILYKGKEFIQHITGSGLEEQRDSEFDHDASFLRQVTKNGHPLILKIPFDGYEVSIKPYQLRLADKTILYFLSSDVDGNPPEWISDMFSLYRGDMDSQIRQQIILGVGGVKLLRELNYNPLVYHINEGRPALLIWELVKILMEDKKLSFDEAWRKAKETIVYTNHTLVAAGNLTYTEAVVKKWASAFAVNLGIDPYDLIKDGMIGPNTFSTTLFALKCASKHCAVSRVHATYCKGQWPDYNWISITNGIHLPRWQDSDFRTGVLSDRKIWELHQTKKKELQETVIKRTGLGYDTEKLVVTWARRLAEYKQPKAIFQDIKRLKAILGSSSRPVQLLFAGNSHSGDPNAKSIVDEIIKIFSTELSGHAIFIPNYNISLANNLVSGSDIWLNTPKGNLEACGTSGMKAIANGVLSCTVADGWTHEVDWKNIGWVLEADSVSESFYTLMENEIIPLYYERNSDMLPTGWIKRMKASIELSKNYSSQRVFEEYKEKLYGVERNLLA